MISLRYSAGKVWAHYALAIVGGLVVVLVLGSLWRGGSAGATAGIIVVAVMFVIGAIKRSARRDPILVIDDRGITVGLPEIGTVPWNLVRSAEIKGIPWLGGVRLIIDYAGTAPRTGFGTKLNYSVYSKQRGDLVRLMIGFLDQTDHSILEMKTALAQRSIPHPA